MYKPLEAIKAQWFKKAEVAGIALMGSSHQCTHKLVKSPVAHSCAMPSH